MKWKIFHLACWSLTNQCRGTGHNLQIQVVNQNDRTWDGNFANVGGEEQKDAGGTCSVSSQQASGERHVSKKSFPALNSRNSGCHDQFDSCYGDRVKHVAHNTAILADVDERGSINSTTWQVSSRLPHAPHWDMLGLLATCRSQECVVLELGEVLRSGEVEGEQNRCQTITLYAYKLHWCHWMVYLQTFSANRPHRTVRRFQQNSHSVKLHSTQSH